MKKQSGFTLIELAIVLVIIGLLLGGVLKGQELIQQAKIKNIVNDLNSVQVAYHGYIDRYRATPGDDAGAVRWGSALVVGNADGSIAGKYNAQVATPTTTDESNLFWRDLRLSGFMTGAGSLAPGNAVGGITGVQTGDANSKTLGTVLASTKGTATTGFSGPVLCTSNLPDKVAIAIDTQLDDGNIQTGAIRGFLQTTAGNTQPDIPADADATNYVETGTNYYTVCKAL